MVMAADPTLSEVDAVKALNDDRRKEPRYRPTTEDANLGWWEGSQYETVSAHLDDISSGGAALILNGANWHGGDVWVCLSGGVCSEWVRGQVVGVSTREDGDQRVRLVFPETCPFEFFKAAVWGQRSPKALVREDAVKSSEPHRASSAGGPTAVDEGAAIVAEMQDPMRALRISVALYQENRPFPHQSLKRISDEDERLEILPSAYVSTLAIVAAVVVACVIVIKFLVFLRVDTILGGV